jgi:hypothetical protein
MDAKMLFTHAVPLSSFDRLRCCKEKRGNLDMKAWIMVRFGHNIVTAM